MLPEATTFHFYFWSLLIQNTAYKFCNISVIIRLRFLYLVSLKRLTLLSKSDLTLNRSAIFPLTLASQMFIRNCATIHTTGVSSVRFTCSSSLRTWEGVIPGQNVWQKVRTWLPTVLVKLQKKKQCSRLACTWSGQNLQLGLELGRILESLSSVGRMQWRSFHKKEVASEPRPFSLERLHESSQSVPGDNSSAYEKNIH